MEPVTHLLTGACLGRAGLNRTTALATITATLAAEAPDIDILWYFRGSVVGFAHHRGFTHTLLGVPIMAAIVVAFVWTVRWLWLRFRPPMPPRSKFRPPLRWGLLYAYACLGTLTHLLLDFTNNYGVRPFSPFSPKWYAWSIVYIIDPVLLAVLIVGLLAPLLFGLVSLEVGARAKGPRGRGWAIFALLCMVALWGFRGYERSRALAAMDALEYQGQQPVKLFVSPYMVDPFRWHGVVETRGFFQTLQVDSRTPAVDPDNSAVTYFKPPESPATLAAKDSYLGHVYLDWSMFPVVQTEDLQTSGGGYRITFFDLRFAYPERQRPALGAYVVLDANDRVVREAFHSRKPQQAETVERTP